MARIDFLGLLMILGTTSLFLFGNVGATDADGELQELDVPKLKVNCSTFGTNGTAFREFLVSRGFSEDAPELEKGMKKCPEAVYNHTMTNTTTTPATNSPDASGIIPSSTETEAPVLPPMDVNSTLTNSTSEVEAVVVAGANSQAICSYSLSESLLVGVGLVVSHFVF